MKKPLVIISKQNSTSSFTFSLRYCKDIVNLLFWVFQACLWLCTPKVILSICRFFFSLSADTISISKPIFFWRHCKDVQTYYFGYFGHVWLYTTKMIASTCRRLRCLSACQKQSSSSFSYLKYYTLKKPAILSADSIWFHNLRRRVLPEVGLLLKYQ